MPSLDALRGGMMLLGLVVHGGVAYVVHDAPGRWPYADPMRSLFFDVALYVIHVFRMPVFFVLAGYFALRVWRSRGLAALVRTRARRILAPLAIFVVPAALADVAAFAWCESGRDAGAVGRALLAYRFQGEQLGHLWFLSHLVWMNAALALALWRAPAPTTRLLARAASLPGLALCLLALTAVLFGEPYGVLATRSFLWPDPAPLLAHSLFFAQGCALALDEGWAARLAARAPGIALGALGALTASFGTLWLLEERGVAEQLSWGGQAWVAGLSALTMLASSLAWVGMALRVRLPHWRWLRELSDASYWVYLTHHALIVFVVGTLGPVLLPALLKWSVAALLTLGLCYGSYRGLVRGRWLGGLVGGAGVRAG